MRTQSLVPPCALTALTALAAVAALGAAQEGARPDEVCFKYLGCFSTAYPWRSTLRPLPAPDTPENIGTRFYLFTRNRPQRTPVTLHPTVSLRGLDFDARRRTVFICHGLGSSSNATWMVEMKDAMLQKMDANVFLIDWAPGAAGFLKYWQAASNTRVVAAEVSRFIDQLVQVRKVDLQNIHLIGHSLGAHISAYVGKKIKNIGRLTALDPAQPAFEGFDRTVRLDASDATFVEVVHTHGKPTVPTFGLGMIKPHGDVDYYVNGGFLQPGCFIPKSIPPVKTLTEFLELPVSAIMSLVSCPHGRATLVYTEALKANNCTFWGHPGSIVENFAGAITLGHLHRYITPSDEECTTKNCSPLNLENIAYPSRGSFTVATKSGEPFCVREPKVDLRMARELRSMLLGAGRGALRCTGRSLYLCRCATSPPRGRATKVPRAKNIVPRFVLNRQVNRVITVERKRARYFVAQKALTLSAASHSKKRNGRPPAEIQ